MRPGNMFSCHQESIYPAVDLCWSKAVAQYVNCMLQETYALQTARILPDKSGRLNCVQVGSCCSCGFTINTAVEFLQRKVNALFFFLCCLQGSKRTSAQLSEHVTNTVLARAVVTICAPYYDQSMRAQA